VVADEAEALLDVARRYAARAVTYGQAAGELNEKGFRTRQGRRFTTASVRFLLGNPILAGYLTYKRGRELQEGKHQAIIPRELFEQIQDGRLQRERRPTAVGRSYLLKGIAACVHCGEALWSEWISGRGYYRESHATRQHDGCPASGRSVPCKVIDAQVGELFGRLHLPEHWREAIERRALTHDRRASIELERKRLREHLRRITNAYIDGNVSDETYSTRQRAIRDELDRLVMPELQAAVSAGKLLADMRCLWASATAKERHELLRPMVSHVYVDVIQRRVVGIKPRPAFRDLFAEALTGTPDVLLIPPEEAEARLLTEAGTSFRGGGDGGESNSPSREGPG
jgi:site-specific DNA recombinase